MKRKFQCCLCDRHPTDEDGRGSVYRINPLGEVGVWACEDCYPEAKRLFLLGRISAEGVVSLYPPKEE